MSGYTKDSVMCADCDRAKDCQREDELVRIIGPLLSELVALGDEELNGLTGPDFGAVIIKGEGGARDALSIIKSIQWVKELKTTFPPDIHDINSMLEKINEFISGDEFTVTTKPKPKKPQETH